MPYKDPVRKAQWERLHHAERLARRRELRRLEVATVAPGGPPGVGPNHRVSFPWLPLAIGAGVSFFKPRWGLAIGGGAILYAVIRSRNWVWYFAGAALIAISIWSATADFRSAQVTRPARTV
jgi:hypothetical protein